jgi:hypothetical protein
LGASDVPEERRETILSICDAGTQIIFCPLFLMSSAEIKGQRSQLVEAARSAPRRCA